MANFRSGAILLIGATLVPFAAHAQQAPSPPTPADEPGVADIIVTAQRKQENLQKAALAVSVLSGDALEQARVTQPQDLTRLVPALKLGTGGGAGTTITLRGVGSFAGNSYAEPGVAINLDGVYIARGFGANGLFYDLSRVEVLKGPQGTLYGRNATAGAINIITRKPTDNFGAEGGVEVGNYNKRRIELALNAPVSDFVAFRVSGVLSRRDGYYSDGYLDDNTDAARAQLKLDKGGRLNVLLSADYTHIGGKGAAGVFSTSPNGYLADNPYTGPSRDGSNTLLRNVSNAITDNTNPNLLPALKNDGFVDVNNWGVSATINYNFGGASLVVIPAYRRSEQHILQYNAGFPITSDDLSKVKSLEVRLSSIKGDSPLQWLMGGYYYKEDLTFSLKSNQGVAFGDTNPILATRSLAAFGQLTYSLTETLRLTGGIRYTNEEKTQAGRQGSRVPSADPNGAIIYFPLTGDISSQNVTFKTGVEFDVAPKSLLYGDVRTGFKAGGFFPSSVDNTYRPEKLTAYTIGSKNRLFGNKLQLNAEAFYWLYRDKQVSHIGPVQPAGFNLITENAGKAEIYGAEAEAILQLTSADRFSANVQYLHTNYTDFKYTQTTLTGPPQTACPTSQLNATSVIVDCSGRPLPRAPRWTLDLSYQHRFRLNDGGAIDVEFGTRIEGTSFLGEEYLSGERQNAYRLSNASLTWHSPDQKLSIGGFIDNIEDRAVKTGAFVQPIVGLPLIVLGAPRTYGARLGFAF